MANKELSPTALPWKVVYNDYSKLQRHEIWSEDDRFFICPVACKAMDSAHNETIAKFIVKACNAHESSIEALRQAARVLESMPHEGSVYQVVCAAIDLAKGGK